MGRYVLARAAGGRPSLQHKLKDNAFDETECGVYIGHWSRAYTDTAIPQILCKKCEKSHA